MKFFEPNSKFLPAIKKLVPRTSIVVDCGCGYMGHDRITHLILKQKPDVLMNFGWVRVHTPADWCCYKDLTANQEFFMQQNNYDMKYHYGDDTNETLQELRNEHEN